MHSFMVHYTERKNCEICETKRHPSIILYNNKTKKLELISK